MKIARIDTIPLAIPHEHGGPPPAWGGQAWEALNILLVRVETDDGAVGWGEAFSYNCMPAVQAMVDATVAPILIGRDATNITSLMRELQQALHLFGRYGITMFGISAIDIALWDLAAKRAGVPARAAPRRARFAGARPRLREPSEVPRSRARRGQRARCARRRLPRIKLHETGESEVAAARGGDGEGVPMCVDTNCPWTPAQAKVMANRLKVHDLHWLEEPIFPPEDFAALARLQRESGVDLACGENACTAFEFRRLIDSGAARYVQPGDQGGRVTEFFKIVTLAEARGATVMPHSPYFGPGWLATLQFLGAMPLTGTVGGGWIERFYTRLEATLYPDFVSPIEGGRFPDSLRPRLGAEPDPDVIRDYRTRA